MFSVYVTHSYLILAPTIMYAEKEPKNAAAKCFEEIGLDPDSYRIGHTKARKILFESFFSKPFFPITDPTLTTLLFKFTLSISLHDTIFLLCLLFDTTQNEIYYTKVLLVYQLI